VSVDLHYKVDEDGLYILYDGEDVLYVIGEEIAVLFSKDGILFKHGSKASVEKYFVEVKQKAAGTDLVDDWMMFVGQLPVEELNKMISTSGYLPLYLKVYT